MATVNQAEVKFIADLGAFTSGVNKAADEITRTLKPAIDSANKSGAALESVGASGVLASKKIKGALGDLGRAGRSIAPLIGGPLGEVVTLGALGASAIKGVAVSLINLVTPLGAATIGLGAAAAAVGYFTFRSEALSVKNAVAGKTLDGMREQLKKLSEEAVKAAERVEAARRIVDKIDESEFGPGKGTVPFQNDRFGTVKQFRRQDLAAAETAKTLADQAVATKQLDIVNKELVDSLRQVELQYKLDGDELERMQGTLDAFKKAKLDAIKVEGASIEELQSFSDSVKSSDKVLTDYKEHLEATTRAEQDFAQEGEQAARQRDEAIRKAGFGNVPGFQGPVQEEKTKDPADSFIRSGTAGIVRARLDEIEKAFQENGARIAALQTDLVESGIGTYNQLAQGIGDAIGRAIVYQEDLGVAAQEVLAQVAANVISTLIQIAAQQLLLAILGNKSLQNQAGNKVGVSAETAGAAAYADAVVTQGLAGLATGPAFAAIAIAGTLAAAAAGAALGQAAGRGSVVALAKGGIATGPVNALIGESGHEVVLPLSRLREFVQTQSQTIVVHNMLDGKVLSTAVLKRAPGILRQRGVRG